MNDEGATTTEDVILDDVVDAATDPYQWRFICLKMAHLAQQIEGDLDLKKVMIRADRYWEFILGVNDDAELRNLER